MTTEFDKIREDAHLWRARLDDGACDADERAQFESWIEADPRHAEALAESEIVWKALGAVTYDPALQPPGAGFDVGRSRSALLPFSRRTRRAAMGAAAAVAACIGLLFFTPLAALIGGPAPERFETALGDVQTFSLDDGSVFVLGAKSRADVTFTEAQRDIRLHAGDAYFEVASDKARPFVVETETATVRVTGTAFEVQRQGDALHIAVGKGTVEVTKTFDFVARLGSLIFGAGESGNDGSRATIALSAGQAVRVSPAQGFGDPRDIRPDGLAAWRRGQLVFLRASLAEVIDDVNRYATQPIALAPDARALKLSGTFKTDDIDGLLATLSAALPVNIVTRDGRRTLVLKK